MSGQTKGFMVGVVVGAVACHLLMNKQAPATRK